MTTQSKQTSDFMVEVKNLTKVYPGNVQAVDDISFEVRRGEFFGLLGPNGAGKTTAMKILGTLVRKTSGTARVLGVDVEANPNMVRSSIGFALQEISLDQLATGRETLVLSGLLYHMAEEAAQARAKELLELFGLVDAANRKVAAYSGGMRRRLDLASVLMHEPKLLFLDEPTEGLDPASRKAIWEYLEKLNAGGVTIFLTTHYMEEADWLCDRLAIIDHGKIVVQDTPEALKRSLGADIVNLKLSQIDGKSSFATSEILRRISGVTEVQTSGDQLLVFVKDAASKVPELFEVLSESSVKVESVTVAGPTLNDVFLKYTGRQIRDEEVKAGVDPMMQMWVRGRAR